MLLWMKPVCQTKFQSTLPARGATINRLTTNRERKFQSTLPARGATKQPQRVEIILGDISIHAPRTGSDAAVSGEVHHGRDFNPRSPHGERQSSVCSNKSSPCRFQSTLPARGATTSPISSGKLTTYFNPRSPYGERRYLVRIADARIPFQSTLPARGATRQRQHIHRQRRFQSTLPARGATCRCQSRFTLLLFQSTLPARGATIQRRFAAHVPKFQSTLPARGATQQFLGKYITDEISIHAPRTGSDAL